jgi:hypothetical protein
MFLVLVLDVTCSPEWYEKKLHISLGLKELSERIYKGYKIGNDLILINGILTFAGLYFISYRSSEQHQSPEQAPVV